MNVLKNRIRVLSLVVVTFAATTGCGSNSYEEANLERVQPLLDLSELLNVSSVSSETYCRSDSCYFGSDGTQTIVGFEFLDKPDPSFEEIVLSRFRGWSVESVPCWDSDGECADDLKALSLSDDGARVLVQWDQTGGKLLVDIDEESFDD